MSVENTQSHSDTHTAHQEAPEENGSIIKTIKAIAKKIKTKIGNALKFLKNTLWGNDEVISTHPKTPEKKQEKVKEHFDEIEAGYQAFQEFTGLKDPIKIYYPACGDDNHPAKTFPKSEIWHLDINKQSLNALKAKISSEKHHIVEKSALEFDPPEEVDLVIMHNDHIPKENREKNVTRKLKENGYVICSDWSGASNAESFVTFKDFELIGFIETKEEHGQRKVSINTDIAQIKKDLIAKKSSTTRLKTSVHAGKIFVFKKVGHAQA